MESRWVAYHFRGWGVLPIESLGEMPCSKLGPESTAGSHGHWSKGSNNKGLESRIKGCGRREEITVCYATELAFLL